MEQHAISSDLIRGHIDTIILHTLLSGDKFAQQISDAVEEKSDGEYKINQATLYSSLKRLESLKHVSSYWFDSVSGRRKYFKLTDSGKNIVETNLSSWSYSRGIIDKLMDCSPQPIYKVEYVEKIVPMQVSSSNSAIDNDDNDKNEKIVEKSNELPVVEKETQVVTDQNKQEVNFRNILNGLIKSTAPVQPAHQEAVLEPLEKTVQKPEEQPEKLKFNDTLTSTNYNAQKSNNNGKIDFGDLSLKAAKEGYKIRISSKDSAITEGTLLINKLNAFSSVVLLLLMVVEFVCLSVLFNSILNLNFLKIALTSIFILAYPTVALVKFLRKPMKKSTKKVYSDVILTSAIAVFNLLLITFATNLLFGVDFTDRSAILVSFIIPTTVYLDIFAYFVIKFCFAKADKYYIKRK